MQRQSWVFAAAVTAVCASVGSAMSSWAADDSPAGSSAVATSQPGAGFEQAMQSFTKARQGDGGQAEKAVDAFGALVKTEPGQPVYRAYLGSAHALLGRDAWAPWSKLRHTERGLEMLDEALAALKPEHDAVVLRGVPVSVETRLVAASTFVAVPDGIFHRRPAARKEVAALLSSPVLGRAPAGVQAAAHLVAADMAKADKKAADEATQLRAAAAFAGTPEAEQAQARLKVLKP